MRTAGKVKKSSSIDHRMLVLPSRRGSFTGPFGSRKNYIVSFTMVLRYSKCLPQTKHRLSAVHVQTHGRITTKECWQALAVTFYNSKSRADTALDFPESFSIICLTWMNFLSCSNFYWLGQISGPPSCLSLTFLHAPSARGRRSRPLQRVSVLSSQGTFMLM